MVISPYQYHSLSAPLHVGNNYDIPNLSRLTIVSLSTIRGAAIWHLAQRAVPALAALHCQPCPVKHATS